MSVTYHQENRFLNKSTWGDGPWQKEPDKIQWTDERTGLPCLGVRHPTSGHWCGYVGVSEGHPAFGLHYNKADALAEPDENGYHGLDVHGGLTFSDFCDEHPDAEAQGICHVPQPGQPEKVWWLGFDCGHAFDLCPAYDVYLRHQGIPTFRSAWFGTHYRTLEYVQEECAKLATQLRAMA